MRKAILFIVVCLSITQVFNTISTVDETIIQANQAYAEREGVYSKSDSPSGNGNSIISFDFIWSPEVTDNSTMYNPPIAEVLLAHSSVIDNIGYVSFWDVEYCCSSLLILSGHCDTPDRLIISGVDTDPQVNGNKLYYWAKSVNGTIDFSESIEPMVSGIWYLIMANCDSKYMRNLIFQGSTHWESPFGYLPAQAYGNMIVYWILTIMYLSGLIAWSIFMYKYRQDLHKYQHSVTALIAISVVEELLWSIANVDYNNTGVLAYGLIGVAVVFSAGKLTGIRFILLLMGSGYAITVDKIVPIKLIAMAIVCMCYYATAATDAYIKMLALNQPVSSEKQFLTASLLVVFNGIIIFWIICSTLATMKRAKSEKNQKYTMYKKLLIIFGIICAISIIAFFAVVGISFSGLEDAAYQWYWLLNCYWDFIYFSVNVYIAYVWRPDADNLRYAYVAVQDTNLVELEDPAKSEVGESY